jgi:tRNA A-37 threonylcarbamoyl transferase component Bud32
LYLRFARTDPLFYDRPDTRRPRRRPLHLDLGRDWTGWRHADDGDWSSWDPGVVLPDQGWKIHVAATPAVAREVLRAVSGYCHAHRLAFKHVPDADTLVARNAKDADRAAAGKFITVYPRDEAELLATLDGLEALVGGSPGPYVLSDLRWNAGPLHVRYGAFTPAWTRDEAGRPVPALRGPDGVLVEDRRTAAFTPPPWVRLPDALRTQRDALGGTAAPADFPYTVTRALHHSAAGGVYEATDADGRRVVLKEARPHAGLTPDGRDAVDRLRAEEAHLRALAGPDVVAVRDALTVHGHRFLVLDHVPGTALHTEVVARCPAIRSGATPAQHLEYRQWALDVAGQVGRALDRLHAAGLTHGDLHPGNVLVTPDGRVVLLDLEMAAPLDGAPAPVIGAPGFVAPDGRGGAAADRYALACLQLFLFCPLTTLLALDPLKADELLDFAVRAYALPGSWRAAVLADLALPGAEQLEGRSRLARVAHSAVRAWETSTEDDLLGLQVLIGRSVAASADLSRRDRAWPGDPQQLSEQGYGLAHGAAGVLHALEACSLDVEPQGWDWLADATHPRRGGSPTHLGLYDGLAGVAWLHRRAGHDREADRLRADLLAVDPGALGPDLYGGTAGLGLYLLSEADRDPALVGRAADLARGLRAHEDDRGPVDPAGPTSVPTGTGGLMRGPSGTALLALRLYERTGDPAHLRLATDALDRDLAHCAVADDGSLQVDEGWRLLPYLGSGSAGVGLVLAQALPHLPDPERYLLALDGVTAAACAPFVIEPGLLQGRAGLIHYLVLLARLGLGTPASDAALAAHVDALRLHAVRHATGIGFPGQGLLRLSCDLATGSAGVLTALQAWTMLVHDEARAGWDALLPGLLPASAPVRQHPRRTQLSGRG